MPKQVQLKISPKEASDNEHIIESISKLCSIPKKEIAEIKIIKKSIDARSKQIWINLVVDIFYKTDRLPVSTVGIPYINVTNAAKRVIIVGAGPAGYFAALELIKMGIKPIIIERGKTVRDRRRDLAALNKQGIINPESNYCFGEGGAGTYSDGKLYTRSNKRGSIEDVLNTFIQFGADAEIGYLSHPHIGTNKLPKIIESMRDFIESCGGEVHFNTKLTDINLDSDGIKSLQVNQAITLQADAYILATGHSARDIFELLYKRNIHIEAKPFALGVRVEHPQQIIDSIQYHCPTSIPRNELLPAASYSLVHQVDNTGVFSFCMCPGGIIAPASTSEKELVVNGWSPSKRNNPFANSGIVVSVQEAEVLNYAKKNNLKWKPDAFLFMQFQQHVEQKAYSAGGGHFVAPANRLVDFCNSKHSTSLPNNSYLPGLQTNNLTEVLPNFIRYKLVEGFKAFGNKMKGYYTNEAIVVATESRTSSPIRIPRNKETLQHNQVLNLYPCAEGAGYAGGIVSAAMDGINVAKQIAKVLLPH